jgi:hypothetical protein
MHASTLHLFVSLLLKIIPSPFKFFPVILISCHRISSGFKAEIMDIVVDTSQLYFIKINDNTVEGVAQ